MTIHRYRHRFHLCIEREIYIYIYKKCFGQISNNGIAPTGFPLPSGTLPISNPISPPGLIYALFPIFTEEVSGDSRFKVI